VIGDRGYFCGDFEGAIATRCEFRGWVVCLQIAAFKPNLFAFFELDWNKAFFCHMERGLCFVQCFLDLSESRGDIWHLGFFIG
jgi:hypothetical protein